MLAAMAAKLAGCPVKLALERTQMVGPVGARPMTEQHMRIGAAADGKLAAVIHDTISSTSFIDDFPELCGGITRMLYDSDSLQTTQRMATLNLGAPTFMRAPGESTGSFALESALDELAYALQIDPIQLRLQNYAERDPAKDLPWSSKSLRECYRVGAERFGWSRRTAEPAIDARRPYSGRLGNGDGDLSRLSLAGEGVGQHPGRRHARWCAAARTTSAPAPTPS